jgi:hypothetical protein
VATYSGSGDFLGSTSSLTQRVARASTTTSVDSSANPSLTGNSVTYTALVNPVAPGGGAPTGTVAFTDGGTTITGCGAAAVTAGAATCSISYSTIGTHSIVATYSGDTNFNGSPSSTLKQHVVAAPTGYVLGAADGNAFAFGTTPFQGSLVGHHLNAPIVGIAATPDEQGYWMVGADGGVFTFGNAGFFGSEGGTNLGAPIVGMAATPDGQGYWLVAADGGVFSFGDAGFHGSEGGKPLNAPVVGMASAFDGQGYWLVAADGGVFTFGNAGFRGSMGGAHLNAPMVGMISTPAGQGYWLVAADGGVFTFGTAQFVGSKGGMHLNAPVVGMAN